MSDKPAPINVNKALLGGLASAQTRRVLPLMPWGIRVETTVGTEERNERTASRAPSSNTCIKNGYAFVPHDVVFGRPSVLTEPSDEVRDVVRALCAPSSQTVALAEWISTLMKRSVPTELSFPTIDGGTVCGHVVAGRIVKAYTSVGGGCMAMPNVVVRIDGEVQKPAAWPLRAGKHTMAIQSLTIGKHDPRSEIVYESADTCARGAFDALREERVMSLGLFLELDLKTVDGVKTFTLDSTLGALAVQHTWNAALGVERKRFKSLDPERFAVRAGVHRAKLRNVGVVVLLPGRLTDNTLVASASMLSAALGEESKTDAENVLASFLADHIMGLRACLNASVTKESTLSRSLHRTSERVRSALQGLSMNTSFLCLAFDVVFATAFAKALAAAGPDHTT